MLLNVSFMHQVVGYLISVDKGIAQMCGKTIFNHKGHFTPYFGEHGMKQNGCHVNVANAQLYSEIQIV